MEIYQSYIILYTFAVTGIGCYNSLLRQLSKDYNNLVELTTSGKFQVNRIEFLRDNSYSKYLEVYTNQAKH